MTAGSMAYSGPLELQQYTVTAFWMEKINNNTVAAAISFQRIYSNHLYTTFIPASCLLMVSYSTLFFKKEHFKTSVPVVITTLLGGTWNYSFDLINQSKNFTRLN